MPRPKPIIPNEELHITLPQDVKGRLSLALWSELEQRVPFGAYNNFFKERVREYFERGSLDLAPFLDCPPGSLVFGPKHLLEQLSQRLSERRQ